MIILPPIGCAARHGTIVALLEDHGTPCADWLQRCSRARIAEGGGRDRRRCGECVDSRVLNWAVYYCDFGRYQNPVRPGPAEFLSDSNVAYKRARRSESVKEVWSAAYHETSVNWAPARIATKC